MSGLDDGSVPVASDSKASFDALDKSDPTPAASETAANGTAEGGVQGEQAAPGPRLAALSRDDHEFTRPANTRPIAAAPASDPAPASDAATEVPAASDPVEPAADATKEAPAPAADATKEDPAPAAELQPEANAAPAAPSSAAPQSDAKSAAPAPADADGEEILNLEAAAPPSNGADSASAPRPALGRQQSEDMEATTAAAESARKKQDDEERKRAARAERLARMKALTEAREKFMKRLRDAEKKLLELKTPEERSNFVEELKGDAVEVYELKLQSTTPAEFQRALNGLDSGLRDSYRLCLTLTRRLYEREFAEKVRGMEKTPKEMDQWLKDLIQWHVAFTNQSDEAKAMRVHTMADSENKKMVWAQIAFGIKVRQIQRQSSMGQMGLRTLTFTVPAGWTHPKIAVEIPPKGSRKYILVTLPKGTKPGTSLRATYNPKALNRNITLPPAWAKNTPTGGMLTVKDTSGAMLQLALPPALRPGDVICFDPRTGGGAGAKAGAGARSNGGFGGLKPGFLNSPIPESGGAGAGGAAGTGSTGAATGGKTKKVTRAKKRGERKKSKAAGTKGFDINYKTYFIGAAVFGVGLLGLWGISKMFGGGYRGGRRRSGRRSRY